MWATYSCQWYDLKMNLWSSRHLEVALITCCWLKLGTCGLLPTIPNWPTQAFCAYSWVCMSGTTFTCPRPQRRIIRMTLTHMVTHTSIQLMPQIFTRFIEGWSLSFSVMHLLQTSLTFSKVCGLWLCEYDLCIDSSIQCFSVGVSGWELQCWGVYLLGINHVVCIGCSDISKGGGWTPITSWNQANDKENLAKVRALGSVSRHLPLFGSSHPFYVGPFPSQSVWMCKTVAGVLGSVGCSLQKDLEVCGVSFKIVACALMKSAFLFPWAHLIEITGAAVSRNPDTQAVTQATLKRLGLEATWVGGSVSSTLHEAVTHVVVFTTPETPVFLHLLLSRFELSSHALQHFWLSMDPQSACLSFWFLLYSALVSCVHLFIFRLAIMVPYCLVWKCDEP